MTKEIRQLPEVTAPVATDWFMIQKSSNNQTSKVSGENMVPTGSLPASALAVGNVKSAIIGGTAGVTLDPNNTSYVGISQVVAGSYLMPVPFNGTIKNLYVYLGTTPGVTDTYTCTLMKENAAQTLTCVVMNGNSASDTTHSFAVVAGNRLSLKVARSVSAAETYLLWCVEYDATV